MNTLAEPSADFAAAVPHVLVLDDNSMITDMLSSMLDMFGYRAATANAGEDALAMLAADRDRKSTRLNSSH